MLLITPSKNLSENIFSTEESQFYKEHIKLSMDIIKEACKGTYSRREKHLRIRANTENSSGSDIIFLNSKNFSNIKEQI